MIRRIDFFGKTDTNGALTIKTNHEVVGELVGVQWLKGDLSSGVKFVVGVDKGDGSVDYDLLTITSANASKYYYPRVETCDGTGGSGSDVGKYVINGALKLSVTSGGNGKEGGAVVFVK